MVEVMPGVAPCQAIRARAQCFLDHDHFWNRQLETSEYFQTYERVVCRDDLLVAQIVRESPTRYWTFFNW